MSEPVDVLASHHRRMLEVESRLTPEVIAARGYRTVRTRAELQLLGFGANQRQVPTLLIPLHGVHGQLVGYQSRPDQPRVGKNGKPIKYETPQGTRMVLDIHPAVRQYRDNPRIPLFVTEGVKKGDALASSDRCAIALLGVFAWRGTNDHSGLTALPDWEAVALNGRDVFIAFDSDIMLKPEVHGALSRLKGFLESKGARVRIIYLPSGPGGSKVGVDDYLSAGQTVDDLLALATEELRAAPASVKAEGDADDDEPASQSDRLVAIGKRAELFHDPTQEPYAAIEIDGHREVWSLRSRRFASWLRLQYHREHHKAPGNDPVKTAIGVLEGIAIFEGPERPLHNRVAWHENAVYYDLADRGWRAVRIDAQGWEVMDRPPVLFRRYAHQQAQMVPVRGGNLSDLFAYLNVKAGDRPLLLVWLVASLIPDIPHPMVEFHGEKGAGKSHGQRVLRRHIDPSEIELLSFPGDVRELVQQLSHHYAPCYDNVDNLPPWLSDLLCRAVTGDGFSKRELYSDDDDVIYRYRRVLMLNGINLVAQRPDLLDRTILIGLDRIPRTRRQEEKTLWARFEEARPRLLGALFNALSNGLRLYPQVHLDQLERMADFTRWGAAIAQGLGIGDQAFLLAYQRNIGNQTREAAEGHVVGAAVLALMREREEWSGTPAQLLTALEQAGEGGRLLHRSPGGRIDSKGWPGAPHILTRRLNEVRSNLADLGIQITETRDDERCITIRKPGPFDPETGDGSDGDVAETLIDDGDLDATDATVAAPPLDGWDRTAPDPEWEAVIR